MRIIRLCRLVTFIRNWALNDISDQRFALEDAEQNLEANYTIERRGSAGSLIGPRLIS
jgi:hypothetical protein